MSDYRLLVFEGAARECRAFLAGVAAAKRLTWDVCLPEECDVHSESLTHRVLEKLHLESDATHIIAGREMAAAGREALAALPSGTGLALALKGEHVIREARLPYRFHAYARESAQAIKQALAALPAGARIEDAKEEERTDPKAKGLEIYSPTHEYELEGEGTLVGGWGEITAMREKLQAIELVQLESIRLSLAQGA